MNSTHIIIDDENEIMIKWHVDDVLNIRPDLTKDQALDVLLECKSRHDASVGINWDVIDITASKMFPEQDEPDDGQPSWEQEWSDFGETYDDSPPHL
jgi:hypothetical protein